MNEEEGSDKSVGEVSNMVESVGIRGVVPLYHWGNRMPCRVEYWFKAWECGCTRSFMASPCASIRSEGVKSSVFSIQSRLHVAALPF